MKKRVSYCILLLFLLSSCSVIQNFALEPSQLETITALREVLNGSTFRAISSLKNLNQNGAEAVLPDELKGVVSKLRSVGLGGEVDKISGQIANVSGIVLGESQGILTDAIKEVDFGDAVAIVVGGEDAATQVLRKAMYVSVKNRYSTRLDQELQKTEVMAYWPMAASAYNLFSSDKIDGSLPDFLAERAVDILFLTMGKEESKIRKDPASLGKAVVTKVFDYYNNRGNSGK